MVIDNTNIPRCIVGNGSSSATVSALSPVAAGAFIHLACSWDGSAFRIYVNGTLSNSTTQSIIPISNTSPLYIGQFGGNADRLDGTIDNVRIYDRALLQSEIQTDMNTPISPLGPDTTPPVRSNGSPLGTIPFSTSATISLITNENATCKYSTVAESYLAMPNTFSATGGASHSTMVSGLVSGGSYSYYIHCQDTAGNKTTTNFPISFSVDLPDTQNPSTPTNLVAAAISSSQINLSWTASTDNVGVTGYRVYRGGIQIATPTGTSYSNTGLSPSTTYSYTVAAVDGTGNVSAQSTSASATTQAAPPPGSWTPPIGIPLPPAIGTGGDNLVTIQAPPYDIANPLHYYVNNSVSCADSNNGGRGAPTAPRCSVPTSLVAGSLVEVRGGPYTGGGSATWSVSGTVNAPVFIRGAGSAKPKFIDKYIFLTGTYGIVENLDISWSGGSGRFEFINASSNHLALRNSYIHHSASNHLVRNGGPDDTVIYNNEISYAGTVGLTEDAGVGILPNSERIWAVDNHIHHNGTDGFLFCHQCTTNAPAYVYIGRNEIHDNGENAIDIKYTGGPVIISQNLIYEQRNLTVSGGGPAIRVNDEGTQGPVWILFNRIRDSINGINPQDADARVYAIGNIIYNIDGFAMLTGSQYAINNTTFNVGSGVSALTKKDNLELTPANVNQYVINAANGDFHLLQSSPAVDAGTPMPQAILDTFQTDTGTLFPLVDFDKKSRPQGTGWDIGAYEYVGGGTPSPTTLIGNLNGDRTVNGADWTIMAEVWFPASQPSDINLDGVVNSIDFSLLNANWGVSI